MTIVITAPTGNTGGRIAQQLIAAGEKVAVLVRDPARIADVIRQNATIYQGSVDDPAALTQATQNADALYLVVPYNFGTFHLRQWQRQVGAAAAAAIATNAIPHVVNLSSNGAHRPNGMGPISGLHAVEQSLNAVAANVVHLRPGFFMENYLLQLDAIRTTHQVFMPIAGDRRLAMIATQDIADVATKLLRDRTWSGQSVLGLHGATDLNFDEAAQILGQVLKQPVTHVQTTLDQFRDTLLQLGATEHVAGEYVEMWSGLARPDYSPAEPRTPETTTPTTFVQFVQDKMMPLLTEPATT
ncbi:NmrA family NAD(P)-binding protein [Phormidium sp. FACHB-592]|uniref:NAD(P)H-binding protein n=1 Tax=Stenomitos frigidus AS-A4 TaxID=2933935 RepID=A0ABV0KTG1_9CYAN|nr:NmrA family NAD(P)-binding protein [Phormidium sp. FACHB-592]MBD2078243.1 NmrA family NAD(P)-binding protein [Phormidium sp. FACHB-592]